MSVNSIRASVTKALESGNSISVAEAKALAKEAKTADELSVLRDAASHDRFEKGARKVLEKAVGPLVEKASGLAGERLGGVWSNGRTLDVVVTRELSPTEGYANKLQALGAARAADARYTAVIADNQKPPRWHAVQTNIPWDSSFAAADNSKLREVVMLESKPSATEFDDLRQAMRDAKAAYAKHPDDPKLKAAAEQALRTLAARTYGVVESEINVIDHNKDASATKINVTLNISHGQAHFGDVDGNAERLDPSKPRGAHFAILGTEAFRDQTAAGGMLTHEVTHQEHHELGEQWAKTWRDSGSTKPFGKWLDAQATAGNLTTDQRDVILEQMKTQTTQTELSSYVNELAVTFAAHPAKSVEAAITFDAIKQRIKALGPDDKKTLQALYDSLDESHRAVFDQHLPKVLD